MKRSKLIGLINHATQLISDLKMPFRLLSSGQMMNRARGIARRILNKAGKFQRAAVEIASGAWVSKSIHRRKIRNHGPKISIVIPVFNGGRYLVDAIESAIRQTYRNKEIIVVDDGSTDGGATDSVIDRYKEFVIAIKKENGGCASALNAGIECATGDFVSWLSHDDVYESTKLERQMAKMDAEGGNETIVYSDFSTMNALGEWTGVQIMPAIRSEDFRYWITEQNCLHGCTLLIPRAAFQTHGGFDVRLKTTQDYAKWFELARHYRFCYQPGLCVKARIHELQGSVAMNSIANREINSLLGQFARGLSHDELSRGGAGSALQGLLRLKKSFEDRGYMDAAEEIDVIMNEGQCSE